MPSDALTYSLCASELNNILKGGRISKITMPLIDTIMLSVRSMGQNHTLIISANPSLPRLHLTTQVLPSPQVAPGFLMHLRKHIGSGSIESIESTPFERVITIKIKAHNELMIAESKSLIVEIMGKHSNIILVNESGIISDSIKHITLDISGKRQILAGLRYAPPPPQIEKINISQREEFKGRLAAFGGGNLDKYLLSILYGISSQTAKEAVFQAFNGKREFPSPLSAEEIDAIITAFDNIYNLENCRPCAQKLNNRLVDFFIKPYESQSCPPSAFLPFDSINLAMDAYYTRLASTQVNDGFRNQLLAIIKNAITKCQKRLAGHLEKQQASMDCEEDKKRGDLILSNIYRIRKGDSQIEVEDFYNDFLPYRIDIDPHKTPQANAQIYYKSYNKKKTALKMLDGFINELNESIDYLENLAYFAETIDGEEAYQEITEELYRLGYVKKRFSNKKEKKVEARLSYAATEFNGYKILIGKSSLGNDALVRKSQPYYLWLHASGIHGSHVIIENSSEEYPPYEVILHAAELAALHSKAKHSQNIPVDYTFIKNVKKPRGAAPGKVIFTLQKTVYVSPVSTFK